MAIQCIQGGDVNGILHCFFKHGWSLMKKPVTLSYQGPLRKKCFNFSKKFCDLKIKGKRRSRELHIARSTTFAMSNYEKKKISSRDLINRIYIMKKVGSSAIENIFFWLWKVPSDGVIISGYCTSFFYPQDHFLVEIANVSLKYFLWRWVCKNFHDIEVVQVYYNHFENIFTI